MQTTRSHSQKPSGDSWQTTVFGVLPFLLSGLAAVMMTAPLNVNEPGWVSYAGGILYFGGYLILLLGLLRGWLSGFPRWVFPYLIYSILFSFLLFNATTPGLEIFGIPLFGRELWGWRAFVPLGFIVLLALALSRPPWGNLVRFAKTIWRDWTILSFGLYSLMPFVVMVGMDEVQRSFRFPVSVLATVVIILGALGSMRLRNRWLRMAVLLGCAALSTALLIGAAEYFWQTHDANFATGQYWTVDVTLNIERILQRTANRVGIVMLVLLAPLPLGALHWVIKRFAPPAGLS